MKWEPVEELQAIGLAGSSSPSPEQPHPPKVRRRIPEAA